jgi:hypothetical protein
LAIKCIRPILMLCWTISNISGTSDTHTQRF